MIEWLNDWINDKMVGWFFCWTIEKMEWNTAKLWMKYDWKIDWKVKGMIGKSFMIICSLFRDCPSFLFPPKVYPTPSHPLYPRMRINLALFKPAHQSSVLTNKGKSSYLSPFLCFLFPFHVPSCFILRVKQKDRLVGRFQNQILFPSFFFIVFEYFSSYL